MPGFFHRRSNLGLAVDMASGSFKGFTLGAAGCLATQYSYPHIALATASTSPVLAMAGACALGGAVAIIPALFLREATRNILGLNDDNTNHHFMLNTLINVTFDAVFAASSACIGAAVLGYALVPVVTTALTGFLVFEVLKAINHSLKSLSNAVSNTNETRDDKLQGPDFAMSLQ